MLYCLCKENFTLRGGTTTRNNVEYFRNIYKENQEGLARAVGVSRQTIISIEKGKYNPSILLAFKIAHHYNTTIETIFIYEEESK